MRKVKLPKQLLDQVIQKTQEYKKAIGESFPILLEEAGKNLFKLVKF